MRVRIMGNRGGGDITKRGHISRDGDAGEDVVDQDVKSPHREERMGANQSEEKTGEDETIGAYWER